MLRFEPEKLAEWSGGVWEGTVPPSVQGFSHDTRSIDPGSMYVAIPGERVDGHQFVAEAFDKGASAALVSTGHKKLCRGTGALLCVADVRQALSDIARGYRQEWTVDVVAVTGSVGKTTVKEMIADMLSSEHLTARTKGNWNNDLGLPLSMLRLERACEYGVFEVGMNHPGEVKLLCDVLQPTCGVVTTLGPVHLEYFESVEAIAREKAALVDAIPSDGFVVLSRDEKWFSLLQEQASCRVITVSLRAEEQADYVRVATSSEAHRMRVQETATGQVHEYQMSLPGEYVMENALRAIAVGREVGLSPEQISRVLGAYSPHPMRWSCETIAGVECINDAYNANPVSMHAAIDTFENLSCEGRKWLVLGGMRELGAATGLTHDSIGKRVAYGGWEGLITVGELGALIADGAESEGMPTAHVERCVDAAAATDILFEKARPGDMVLLKASRSEALENILDSWKKRLRD